MVPPWSVPVSIVMLAGAAVLDVRTRSVKNLYWLPFLVVGLVHLYLFWPGLLEFGIMVWLVCMTWLLWVVHVLGGADSKAMMLLLLLNAIHRGLADLTWGEATILMGCLVALGMTRHYQKTKKTLPWMLPLFGGSVLATLGGWR